MKRKNKGAGDAFAQSGRAALAHLDACYHAAKRGDRDAAKWLLGFAHRSTWDLECLFDVQPALLKEVFAGGDEFPVLRSWHEPRNEKTDRMLRVLDLGSTAPLKPKKHADEFYLRTLELIYSVGLDVSTTCLPPLTSDRKVCQKWADAIADALYPLKQRKSNADGPAFEALDPALVNPVDWRAVGKSAEISQRIRNSRRKPGAGEPRNEELKKKREAREAIAPRMTLGDFRAKFISKLMERLPRAARDSPWHFHGFRR